MQSLWRTLPKLALPAAMGMGLAYLATSFLPRPEPALRPPEELRAHGLAYSEESPVRAILERNVLRLERHPFAPPGSPLPPPLDPAPDLGAMAQLAPPASQPLPAQTQAAFAAPDPVLVPKSGSGSQKVSATLSGGPSVLGLVANPASGATGVADLGIESFRLMGVVAGGTQPVAMVQVDGIAATLHPGEQARGWTLMQVQPGKALLKRGQQSHWLKLSNPIRP